MKTRLLLGLALLALLAVPLLANARERSFRVRDDRGESRIIISGDDGTVVLDEDDLEELLEQFENMGPEIEQAIEQALSGLDELDFDFDFDFDPDGYGIYSDWDERDWERWSERMGERTARINERVNERVQRAIERAQRGNRSWRFADDDEDDRDEMRDEIRRLQSEIRRLTRELDDLRGDG